MSPRRRRRSEPYRNPFEPLDGPVDETLDLHGFTASEARVAVERVLAAAQRHHPGGLLHLITGKGHGSSGRPVLRGLVRGLLESGRFAAVGEWGPDLDGGGYVIRLKS